MGEVVNYFHLGRWKLSKRSLWQGWRGYESGVQHQKCGNQVSVGWSNTVAAGSFKLELREAAGQETENLEASGHLGERPVENSLVLGRREEREGESDAHRKQQRRQLCSLPTSAPRPAAWKSREAMKQGLGLHPQWEDEQM